MAWWRDSVLAAAVGLEAVAAIAALDGTVGLAAAAHLGSAGAIALGLGRRGAPAPVVLVMAMAVFLPVLGTLGWIAIASIRPAETDRRALAYVRTPIPGPEAARIHAGRPAKPPRSASASARVLAARRRDDPGAIALLRRALADRDEDVRLVAHAVLESKQRQAQARLREAGERDAARERHEAAAHWELIRTDLVEGECLVHALASARRAARADAAERPDSASLALLIARIELRAGALDEAEAALARAVELGLPPAIAAPYSAEAAYLARRFDRVAERLAAAPGDSAALARIRRFWS